MNTFLLNSCAAAAQVVKCGCNMTEVATNDKDLEIVKAICCSVVLVVFILVVGFLIWKLTEIQLKRCDEKRKHDWEVEDKLRRQKAELTNKLIDFQKELAYTYEKGADGKLEKKDFNTEESSAYKKLLSKLTEGIEINDSHQEEKKK